MIGIGITTFRRPDMLLKCMEQILKHTEWDCYMALADDSETEHGVAASKNRCIKVLMSNPDVDHIFLFDDDTWPNEDGWEKPYIDSGMNHLAYIWYPEWDNHRECWPLEGRDDITEWNTSNGCLLYYTRKALETVGGMRPQFGKWGFEHLEHSHRIYRSGLTPAPFISLTDQRGIYACDEHDEHFKDGASTITPAQRREWYERNMALYGYWIEQEPRFVPWD